MYKLARFPDTDRVACERVDANSDDLKTTHITNDIDSRDVVSLISDDESDLALYDFVVLPATQNAKTGQIFYSGSFILATMRGGVKILARLTFAKIWVDISLIVCRGIVAKDVVIELYHNSVAINIYKMLSTVQAFK